MVTEKTIRRITILILLTLLIVLSFMIVKPILMSLLAGLIIAYIFYPVYKKIFSITKEKNIAALLVCILAILIIFLPIWFFAPIIAKQTFEIYSYTQQIDLVTPIRKIFPSFFVSEEASRDLAVAINNFVGKTSSAVLTRFTGFIIDFPNLLLKGFLVIFVFFFALRDGEKLKQYVKQLSPLSPESEKRFFNRFQDITKSVVFGQIVVGIAQGVATGIGLFIFGAPRPVLFTLLAIFVGVLPIIGPMLIWLPMAIYLLLFGAAWQGIGLLIYGFIVPFWIDSPIRAFIVAKKSAISSALILIGMIGGLYVFGVLGIVLGPLIIGYLLIVFDMYKEKRFSEILA